MRFEYVAGTSLLHRLDVRTKLLGVVVALTAAVMFGDPLAQAILAAAALVLVCTLGVPPRRILALLAPLSFAIVMIVVCAALSPRPGPAVPADVLIHLWSDGGLPLTRSGLAWGVSLGLRIVTMVLLTSALVLSTSLEHMVALMRKARLPFAVVFIVMTALRFVPTMQAAAGQIMDAQRARGAQIDSRGMIGSIRAHTTIMVPLFATGLRMSEDLAAAMLARGYGATKHPTQLVELAPSWRDGVAAGILLAALAGAVVLRVTA